METYDHTAETPQIYEYNAKSEVKLRSKMGHVGVIVTVKSEEDIDPLTEYYDEIGNKVYLKIRDLTNNQIRVMTTDIRRTTSSVKFFLYIFSFSRKFQSIFMEER